VTTLPDWLVERAALDEVPAASRDRIDRADPRELAERIAALREDNAAELLRYPAGPAVAQIDARVATAIRKRDEARRRRLRLIAIAASATAVLLFVFFSLARESTPTITPPGDDTERVKGPSRLLAYRRIGNAVEKLDDDALVKVGDVIQLRYNAGSDRYGVIASVDGAGVVTLHYPLHEDAPPEATAVSAETTALPRSYRLDDAPSFERFFFITAKSPIDVQASLAAIRELAQRSDCATASLELPKGLNQMSLRLRKPDRSTHESP
jgi:hypothetical protein